MYQNVDILHVSARDGIVRVPSGEIKSNAITM